MSANEPSSLIIGIDLSGPSNPADTVVSLFSEYTDRLEYIGHYEHCSDADIVRLLEKASSHLHVTIGLDAPLSYQDGGGDRMSDRSLRKVLMGAGMPSGTVMTPTMTRMAYLTLRGITIARLLRSLHADANIVEVHPHGSMALAGAPIELVRTMKAEAASRQGLAHWLGSQGLARLPEGPHSDHVIASIGCAFAAWLWQTGRSTWKAAAIPPHHPFDFAC